MRPFILTTGGQGVAAERCVPQCMAVHGISPKKEEVTTICVVGTSDGLLGMFVGENKVVENDG